ncbi:MAG TPA: hypothetical protein VGG27_18690 [Magnetospirillaceae bacterium]|jgi:hypothetical protein
MRLALFSATIAIALGQASIALADDLDPAEWHDTPYGWSMTEHLSDKGGCGARLTGEQVDTLLMINKHDHIILAAGKSDWKMATGQHEASLQIDDNRPMTVIVTTLGNLVITPIEGGDVELQLRKAAVLQWGFPKTTLRAAVHDVGSVVDMLKDCTRKQHAN